VGVAVPGSATAADPARARAKDTVPKTGPAPESDPGMVPATERDPAVGLGKKMVRAARVTDKGVWGNAQRTGRSVQVESSCRWVFS